MCVCVCVCVCVCMNPFKVFHDIIPLFSPKTLLLGVVGFVLVLSCFLSPHTDTLLVLSYF